MKAKGILYILAAIVIAVFVVANWGLLLGSVELNLLIARVQAPLAVLLLLFAGFILLLDLSVHAFKEYAWMRERRALTRELDAARLRADKEEESRTGTLKLAIEKDLAVVRAQLDRVLATQSTLLGRATIAEPRSTIPSSDEILEPELVPPRGSPNRGPH